MPRSRRKGLQLGYRLQAVRARLLFWLFGMLSLDKASEFGGWLARSFGPYTRAHRTAAFNLRKSLKYKYGRELRILLTGMWDNIGRTLGEYPHLDRLMGDAARVEVVDPANALVKLRDDGMGAVLVGMHSGNWALSTVPGFRVGLKQYYFFPTPDNPFIGRRIARMRDGMGQGGFLPEDAEATELAAALLKERAHIGMLVDQKQDDGIFMPFFGREAMVTTAPASLALQYDLPILASRVVRLKRAKFRIYVEPVEAVRTGDREADIVATTKLINSVVENWVRQNPAQWLWVAKRWPEEA